MYRVVYQLSHAAPAAAKMWQSITSRLPSEVIESDTGPRVLWRREDTAVVQVQYPVRPRPQWLLPGLRAFPHVVDMRVLMESLAVGQRWRFDLTAETVRRHGGKESRTSALEWLTAVHEPSGQPGVLVSRAYESGFRVLDLQDSPVKTRERTEAWHTRLRGVLEVEDAEALRTTMEEGLGRGKSAGAGMLSLAMLPAPTVAAQRPSRRGAARAQ